MTKIYVPSTGVQDWIRLLPKGEKQWKSGSSASCLSEAWEQSRGGLPPEIATLFRSSGVARFSNPEVLAAFPEWKVLLPPKQRHPSQNDLFILARDTGGELMTIMVEGKGDEPFGPRLGEWLKTGAPGRSERLAAIQCKLGLHDIPPAIRYQLLHRTASAVVEAERFRAMSAVMMVHSFSPACTGWPDFAGFVQLFAQDLPQPEKLHFLGSIAGIDLYAGWANGKSQK